MSRKQVKRQRWLDNKKSRQRDETRIGRRELQLPEEVVGSRPQLQEAWGPRPSAACNGDPDLAVLPGPDVFSHPSGQFRARLCPDPTDFFPVAQRLCSPVELGPALAGAGRWTMLTRDIVRTFNSQQQQMAGMEQKILLWRELYRALHTEMDCSLAVFGSTFNGFGGAGCDVDMCLFPCSYSANDKHWLLTARRLLQQHCRHFIRGGIELIPAKVPILKFFDREGRLEVDLSVNNPTSIRNTHLLYCYSQLDYRVRPLVLAVKLWAKDHKINEARFQTLSSYTLTLMVLHFLQAGVAPPVLPCLHNSHPSVFNDQSDIFRLDYSALPDFQSNNRQSLGELLAGFFRYYNPRDPSGFEPQQDVASVRSGDVLLAQDCEQFARQHKISPGQWRAHLLVEEPFDRTNAARAVCNQEKWNLVCVALEAAAARVKNSDSKLCMDDLSARSLFAKAGRRRY